MTLRQGNIPEAGGVWDRYRGSQSWYAQGGVSSYRGDRMSTGRPYSNAQSPATFGFSIPRSQPFFQNLASSVASGTQHAVKAAHHRRTTINTSTARSRRTSFSMGSGKPHLPGDDDLHNGSLFRG